MALSQDPAARARLDVQICSRNLRRFDLYFIVKYLGYTIARGNRQGAQWGFVMLCGDGKGFEIFDLRFSIYVLSEGSGTGAVECDDR